MTPADPYAADDRAPLDGTPEDAEPIWCATPHGRTLHPDDEDHRSDGVPIRLTIPDAERSGKARTTDAEIGLLRRRGDDRTWFVVEDGDDVRFEISLDSARELLREIRSDPTLRAALESG